MTQFAVVETATGRILYGVGRPDPADFAGVPAAAPLPHDGVEYHPWQGLLNLTDRASPTSELRWVDGAPCECETGALAQMRAYKIEEMNAACTAQIVAGFECDALGEVYLYPAKERDQANLVASVTDSLIPGASAEWSTPFWCADAAGVWEYRMHTAAQIQQVGREGKAAILAALGKNEALRQQIDVATVEQLTTIQWDAP